MSSNYFIISARVVLTLLSLLSSNYFIILQTMLSDFSSNPYAKFNDNDEIIVSPGNGKEKMPIQGPIIQVYFSQFYI